MKDRVVFSFVFCCLLAGLFAVGCPKPGGGDNGETPQGGNNGGPPQGDNNGGAPHGSNNGEPVEEPDVDSPIAPITLELLEDAANKLAEGNAEVFLSSDRRIVFRRTTEGAVTVEEVVVDATVVERKEHTETSTLWKRDRDMDGFMEWTATLTRAEVPDQENMVILIHSNDTRQPERKETYTRSGDVIRVKIETATSGGAWKLEREFDTTPNQPANSTVKGPDITGTGTCNATQATHLNGLMRSVIKAGINCMQEKMPAEAATIAAMVANRGIELRCASLPGDMLAEIHWWDTLLRSFPKKSPVVITVDPDKFFKETIEWQRNMLWHEVLHTLMGPHDPLDILGDSRSRRWELDPTYACSLMCFDVDKKANKCHCAACFKTTVCDSRCKKRFDDSTKDLEKCAQPLIGAQCLCVANWTWYNTHSQCLVGCRSGMACFGAACRTVDYSCK